MGFTYTKEERLELAKERGILYDECDKHLIENYTWTIGNHGYAFNAKKVNGVSTSVLLHRFLFDHIPDGFVVDHINKNKLDNRRANLRLVSQSDNMKNSTSAKLCSVVYEHKHTQFLVRMQVGTFKDEEEAEKERDYIMKVLRDTGYLFPHERRYNVAPQP